MLIPIVYHCDKETQHRDLTDFQKSHLLQAVRARERQKAVEGAARPVTLDAIFMHHALDHLRHVLREGSIFAMPFELFLNISWPIAINSVVGAPLPLARNNEDLVYVQVVLKHPAALKTVKHIETRVVPDACMVVAYFDPTQQQREDGHIAVLSRLSVSLRALDYGHPSNTMRVWEEVVSVQQVRTTVALSGFTDAVSQAAVSELINHGALPNTYRWFHVSLTTAQGEALQHLAEHGLAERHADEDSHSWKLTAAGSARILHGMHLVHQGRLLEPPTEQLDSTSSLGLLQMLLQKGWRWERPPPRARLRYMLGQAKIFYSRQVRLCRSYLLCLLMMDECVDEHKVLLHLQKKRYYDRFLAGDEGAEHQVVLGGPGPMLDGDGEGGAQEGAPQMAPNQEVDDLIGGFQDGGH